MTKKVKTKTLPMADKIKHDEAKKIGDVVVIPKVTLFSDHILTTSFRQRVTASGLILPDSDSMIRTVQQVVATGPNASVKVGDLVEINPNRFQTKFEKAKYDVGPDKQVAQVPLEEINKVIYLFLSTRELKWVYNEKPV